MRKEHITTMTQLAKSKERVRRLLMNRIKLYDLLIADCTDAADRLRLYKTQINYLDRLELMCL